MTNRELADHLNHTFNMAKQDAITVNVIRQWVDWGVMPKANPIGTRVGRAPLWKRSATALQQAARLTELRQRGVRRRHAVIAQAYLEWGHADFELVREAVLGEFRKWREKLNRRHTTALGDQKFKHASASRTRAIRNQLGPLDQRFVGTPLEQEPELYALFADAARFGSADAPRMAHLIIGAFEKIEPAIAEQMRPETIVSFASAMAGFTGYPDEISNSAELTIENATERKFEAAREIFREITNPVVPFDVERELGKLGENSKALINSRTQFLSQFSVGPWAVFGFALLIHSQS